MVGKDDEKRMTPVSAADCDEADSVKPQESRSAFHFRLYVSAGSPSCAQALSNLRTLCNISENGREPIIEIVDVRQDPGRAERDRVLAVPTLIRVLPEPTIRILGDLSGNTEVLDLLGLGTPPN